MQFFNRFASEIALLLKCFPNDKARRVTCASLGCGPGSEVFGIIKAWKDVALNFTLDYQGYDQNPVWNDVQSLSKEVFANSPHTINFYTTDMFCDWQGGKNVDILILNYLLSDAVKFQTSNQKQKFLEDIRDFCIDKRVRSIIFNDIRFYGNDNRLNSGFQMVIRLVELLKNATLCNNSLESIRCKVYAFPSDNYARGCKWKVYRSDNLVFPLSEKNRVVKCNSRCGSKQVFIVLKHK